MPTFSELKELALDHLEMLGPVELVSISLFVSWILVLAKLMETVR